MQTRGFIRRALAAVVILSAAGPLGLPAVAEAGSYTVYTCRLPSSQAAATDGWVPDSSSPGIRVTDSCGSGGYLGAEMDAVGFPDTMRRGWRWSAAAGTALREMTLWRTYVLGAASPSATPFRDVLSDSRELEFDAPAAPPLGNGNSGGGSTALGFHETNRVSHVDLRDNVVRVRVGCTGASGSICPATGGSAAAQYIFGAHFLVDDLADPALGAVSGTLARAGTHRGIEAVTFAATDQATGIYRGIVEIDGVPVHTEVIDDNQGRCADAFPWDSNPYQFQYRVPCKLAANGTMRWDTSVVSDGPHELRIRVEDAAGNRATVFGAETITIDNRPGDGMNPTPELTTPSIPSTSQLLANGGSGVAATLTALPVGRNNRVIRVRHGQRVVIVGALRTTAGQPLSRAAIDIGARLRLRGAAHQALGQVMTDESGRFRYVVSGDASRVVDFAFRTARRDSTPSASASVDIRVAAKLNLNVSRHRLHNGQALGYYGALAGVNAGRKLVDVRVIVGRSWRPVCTARTNSRGRYMCRYRFKRTHRRTKYTFRAYVRRQESLPYEPSRSAARRVTVLP